jgi:hypothetical protein
MGAGMGDTTERAQREEYRRIAKIIVAAPDEWTPHFTRAELSALAKAYLAEDRDRKFWAASASRERQRLVASLQAAEKERDEAWNAHQSLAADQYFGRAEKAEARLQAAEEALQLARGLTLVHNIERDEDPESFADLTGFDTIGCKACLFNVAVGKSDRRDPAKVAALGSVVGGRPNEDTRGEEK